MRTAFLLAAALLLAGPALAQKYPADFPVDTTVTGNENIHHQENHGGSYTSYNLPFRFVKRYMSPNVAASPIAFYPDTAGIGTKYNYLGKFVTAPDSSAWYIDGTGQAMYLGNPALYFSNGLKNDGSGVKLGGMLEEPTYIYVTPGSPLVVQDTSGAASAIFGSNAVSLFSEKGDTVAYMSAFDGKVDMHGGEDAQVGIQVSENQMEAWDDRGTKRGLQYRADYSGDLKASPRSIPDVGTVQELIADSLDYALQLVQDSVAALRDSVAALQDSLEALSTVVDGLGAGPGGTDISDRRSSHIIIFDEFVDNVGTANRWGDYHWVSTLGGSATEAYQTTYVQNHPGLLNMKGHSINTFTNLLTLGAASTTTLPIRLDSDLELEVCYSIPFNYASLDGMVTMGLASGTYGITAEPTDGVYVTNSVGIGGTAGYTNGTSGKTTVAFANDSSTSGSYDKLRITYTQSSGTVEFFMNGASQGTSTTNIPTGTTLRLELYYTTLAGSAGNTVANGINIDYVYFSQAVSR